MIRNQVDSRETDLDADRTTIPYNTDILHQKLSHSQDHSSQYSQQPVTFLKELLQKAQSELSHSLHAQHRIAKSMLAAQENNQIL